MFLFCSCLNCLETLYKIVDVGGDFVICDLHVREVAEGRVRLEAVDDEFDGDRFILPYTGVQCQSHFGPDCSVFRNVLFQIFSSRQSGALGFLLEGQKGMHCLKRAHA